MQINRVRKDVNNLKEVQCPGYNDKSDIVGNEIGKEKSLKYFLHCWVEDAYLSELYI